MSGSSSSIPSVFVATSAVANLGKPKAERYTCEKQELSGISLIATKGQISLTSEATEYSNLWLVRAITLDVWYQLWYISRIPPHR